MPPGNPDESQAPYENSRRQPRIPSWQEAPLHVCSEPPPAPGGEPFAPPGSSRLGQSKEGSAPTKAQIRGRNRLLILTSPGGQAWSFSLLHGESAFAAKTSGILPAFEALFARGLLVSGELRSES